MMEFNTFKKLEQYQNNFLHLTEDIRYRIESFEKCFWNRRKYDFEEEYSNEDQSVMHALICSWIGIFGCEHFSEHNNEYLQLDIHRFKDEGTSDRYTYFNCKDRFRQSTLFSYGKTKNEAILNYIIGDRCRKGDAWKSLINNESSYYGSLENFEDYIKNYDEDKSYYGLASNCGLKIEEIEIGYLTNSEDKIFIVTKK